MKKVFMVLICLSMVFAVACSKSKKSSPCAGIDCDGHGICDDSSGRAVCECEEGYVPNGKPGCDLVTDSCENVSCENWQICINGDCKANTDGGFCGTNSDCSGSSQCDPETHKCKGPCDGITCNNHGECHEGTAYGSGYGSGSSYQSDGIHCDCEEGYRPETIGEIPTCIDENCSLECGDNSYCDINGEGEEYCKCIDGYKQNENGDCVKDENGGSDTPECTLECGYGTCEFEGDDAICKCPEGYVNEDNDPTKQCIEDKCKKVTCEEEWEVCKQATGKCGVEYPNCYTSDDCQDNDETCDILTHTCVEDKCADVDCGKGICSLEDGKTVCNCENGYYDINGTCAEMTKPNDKMWIGTQWPFAISQYVGDEPELVFGQIYIPNQTCKADDSGHCPNWYEGTNLPQHSEWKAQLGYKKASGSAEYPIIASTWTWKDATFNSAHKGDNNHEYMYPFPTDTAGNYIYIFRFSFDNGNTWWYADKGVGPDNTNEPGPNFITSEMNYPGRATIVGEEPVPDTLLTLDSHEKTKNSYTFVLSYHGSAAIDFAESEITLNGESVDATEYYDETTKKFTVTQSGLEPNKYSWLFRLVDENGDKIEPFFVPLWIGDGVDYADFGWRDAFIYQIMTDRFLNGDTSNDIGNLSGVTIDLEQWKGGDFRGIIKKLDEGYFTKMGVNALWISTPILNPDYTSQGGTASDQSNIYFTSYHAYHPLATGYSFDNDYGYGNEGVHPAFGDVDEFRELVEKAHKKGIRIIPDFVVNHVHKDAKLYQQHKNDGWFYDYNPCAGHWDDHRIDCWFTPYMPDFNYKGSSEARKAVIDHAIWLIENFNLDGFRADALKHIDDIFVVELRKAIKEKIETTVKNHDMPDEAEVFYTVGESLGGWARYHTRAEMVQGQVNDSLYYAIRDQILHNGSYDTLANKIMYDVNGDLTDTAFLSVQTGRTGGFPGAVMGNFFGNHDQDRALSECNGNYTLLKHAQTFLLTTPINIPMLYQGDDIGMTGRAENGFDGGRRAVMKFDNLSNSEKDALQHVQKLGKFRKAHPALRKGTRSTCASTNDAWVYKFTYEGKTVVVGINKGGSAYTATCSGVSGSFTSYDGSNVNVSNGSVTVPAGGSLVIGN
ncbi:hypothetical protein IKS86_08040 [bacterium]|nr:hypothetical protein [bacterium]